ncbi:hypothetical protein QTQ03_22240 [Micromonospora sp. WMMA1363]|uniref:hypothetical protein n=1 Tax=Micromonospora sp. WMMA1363 TaxID=3053985 RepID=UPI00259D028C|nr:hypothetical protein [Micromonospora sp. WMMA1363]MDM4722174.1 hypothetical protein [Micromonospora sp. WMMA1363]
MPVSESLEFCGPCGEQLDAEMAGQMFPDDLPWAGHRRSELGAELMSLVALIRRLSGLPFDVVNGRLNQAMKVARRADAGAEQLWAGIRAARLWLSALTASHRDA